MLLERTNFLATVTKLSYIRLYAVFIGVDNFTMITLRSRTRKKVKPDFFQQLSLYSFSLYNINENIVVV